MLTHGSPLSQGHDIVIVTQAVARFDTLGSQCAYVETEAQRRLRGTRPEYDIDRACRALADSVGDDPVGILEASCVDGELNARVRIAAMTIPAETLDRCEKQAENPSGGSYLDFERCVAASGG